MTAGTHLSRRSSRSGGARSAPVVDALVIGSLVATASLALGPAYGDPRWLIAAIGGSALGASIAVLAARRRWPWPITVLVTVIVYLSLGTALALPTSAVAGVLPTASSLRQLVLGAVTSWRDLLTVVVPTGVVGGVLIPAFLTCLIAAVVGTSIAVRTRRPLWALAAPALVMVVAATFGASTPGSPVVSGLVVAAGGLAWASGRTAASSGLGLDSRRPAAIGAVLTVAVSAGLAVVPLVGAPDRTALRDSIERPFSPRDHPNPLVGFRTFSKQQSEVDLFTVAGMPAGQRVRLAVFDGYDGITFSPSTAGGGFVRTGARIAVPDGTEDQVDRVTVTVDDYTGVYLPTTGHLRSIEFADADRQDSFRYSAELAAGVLVDGVRRGDTYTAEFSSVPDESTTPGLDLAGIDQVAQPAPARVPDNLDAVALDLAGSASTPLLQVRAIQQQLRSTGFLSHGGENEDRSASGHGVDRLTQLLGSKQLGENMVGDEEQFAPAMALMLRSLGIPARVVMGFRPPEGLTDGASWTVRGSDVTAWVEVPFDGIGWVAFDVRPDAMHSGGSTPVPQDASRARDLTPPPPPLPVVQADTSELDSRTPDPGSNEPPAPIPGPWPWWLTVTIWIAAAIAVILVTVGAIVGAKRFRRRRRRTRGEPADRIALGWQQIVDHAGDNGFRAAVGRTRREAAGDIDARFQTSSVLLADRADARIFSPDVITNHDAERFWTDVATVERTLDASVGRFARWRGAVSPTSLLGQPLPSSRATSPRATGPEHGATRPTKSET